MSDPIFKRFDKASIAVTIADPSADDCPLVYANAAFSKLTGYAAIDVIGRNCRFLQGPDTDKTGVEEVREAVAASQPVSVILKNHRADGSAFDNFFMMTTMTLDGRPLLMGCQYELPFELGPELMGRAAEGHAARLNGLARGVDARREDARQLRVEALRLSAASVFSLATSYASLRAPNRRSEDPEP
ncbi:MAG: PAS domain-containing protein [Parvularculaceae bacterium]